MTPPDGSDVAAIRRSWMHDDQKLTREWGERQAQALWDVYERWDPVIDGQDILDIGCHWGFMLRHLSLNHRPRRLIGIDVAPTWEQVDSGWDWRSDGTVEFHHTDVFGLELPPASLDLVLCSSVFQYLPPEVLDRTLARIRVLLRPGGRLLVRSQVYTSYLGASLHRDFALPYVHLLHGERLLADRFEAARGRRPQYTNWLTPTTYLLAYARAGFEIADAHRYESFLAPEVIERVAAEFPVAAGELRCTGLEAHLIKPLDPPDLDALEPVIRKRPAAMSGRVVGSFRAARQKRPMREYEALSTGDRWAPGRAAEADRVLAEGWKRGSFPRVRLEPPVAWEEVCASNRSWQYHLQAWEPMSLVLSAHQHLGERRYLEYCVALALDWLATFPTPATDRASAWYDMAVGQRAYRLGYLIDAAARDDGFDDQTIARLIRGAEEHARALLDDGRFAGHSNHGLYQAAGQLALATRLPELAGMDALRAQGERRLSEMIGRQFAADGVHREHSPGYHYLLLETLERIVHCGLVDDPALLGVLRRAQDALAWFVMPDGRMPQIGDSSDRTVTGPPFADSASPALRFAATGGREGAPPGARMKAFPESGWVVMRERWPAGPEDFGEGAYLAQIAAFHSRAHKHADDLSFVWFDAGRELLVDAGRYGYLGREPSGSDLGRQGFMYSDPNRVYVESTRAHNTVEVDDTSHPRRVEPYGSGLVGWGDDGDVMHSECAVTVHGTIEHRRVLVLAPGEWLVVVDALSDRRRRRHSYSQRFHFAPELDVRGEGGAVAASAPDGTALWLAPLIGGAAPGEVVRGRTEPEPLGFTSRAAYEMLPTATVALRAERARTHTFATLLSLGGARPEADLAGTVDQGGRRAALRWRAGGAQHAIAFEPGADGRLVVRRERG